MHLFNKVLQVYKAKLNLCCQNIVSPRLCLLPLPTFNTSLPPTLILCGLPFTTLLTWIFFRWLVFQAIKEGPISIFVRPVYNKVLQVYKGKLSLFPPSLTCRWAVERVSHSRSTLVDIRSQCPSWEQCEGVNSLWTAGFAFYLFGGIFLFVILFLFSVTEILYSASQEVA